MKFTKFSLVAIGIVISVSIGYLIGQSTKITVAQNNKKSVETTKTCDLLTKVKEENITEIKVIQNNSGDFIAAIRHVEEPPYDDNFFTESDKFTIFDKNGKSIYETKDLSINNIQYSHLTNSGEIMIETNGGGTDNFLKILELRNGKFIDIAEDLVTQYRGGYFAIPQYRAGNTKPYFSPKQLIVIQQMGGSDYSPSASVFRVKENRLQEVGSIKMQKLGDFIETQIAESNK